MYISIDPFFSGHLILFLETPETGKNNVCGQYCLWSWDAPPHCSSQLYFYPPTMCHTDWPGYWMTTQTAIVFHHNTQFYTDQQVSEHNHTLTSVLPQSHVPHCILTRVSPCLSWSVYGAAYRCILYMYLSIHTNQNYICVLVMTVLLFWTPWYLYVICTVFV